MINFAGTAYSYAKSIQMQYTVNQKMDEASGSKKNPFATALLDFALGMKVTSTDSVNSLSGINTQEVDYRLSEIVLKLRGGKKLSGSDLDYLRQKDPGLYQKALKIEQEREEYEQELRQCRTKEDVHRVGLIKKQMFIAEASKAEAKNDLSAALDIEMRFNAINDVHANFVKSDAFKRLPENYKEIADAADKKGRADGAQKGRAKESDAPKEPNTDMEAGEPGEEIETSEEGAVSDIHAENTTIETEPAAIELEYAVVETELAQIPEKGAAERSGKKSVGKRGKMNKG